MSDPLIERAFSTQDGLVGCRVYWDGAKWVHRHVLMCPSEYAEELKFKEYRDIKGTKVSHVKMCLVNWRCDRERKYRLVSTAIERLAVSGSGEIDLPMDVYFFKSAIRDGGSRVIERLVRERARLVAAVYKLVDSHTDGPDKWHFTRGYRTWRSAHETLRYDIELRGSIPTC